MFDADLILVDGTISIDADTVASYASPTSITAVSATGAAVVDVSKTGVNGLAAVMILPTAEDAGSTDTLTAYIEASDVLAFTSDRHRLGSFQIAGASPGVILGGEGPGIAVTRFATNKKYVRVTWTPAKDNGNGDFGKIKVYLSPYPFVHL